VLTRTLAKLLREHRLASPHKTPADFVFANTLGRPFDYRDAEEGFRRAVKAAGLQAPGKLTPHSLRHGFASLLIAKGLNVVFLSRRLGTPTRTSPWRSTRTCSNTPTTAQRQSSAGNKLRGDQRGNARERSRKRDGRPEGLPSDCKTYRQVYETQMA
jgi:hypothetical protein